MVGIDSTKYAGGLTLNLYVWANSSITKTWSINNFYGHLLPFLLSQEEQMSVDGKRMCTQYW